MKQLIIPKTDFAPRINFDSTNKTFEVTGVSRPENAMQFFEPALNWLEAYIDELSKGSNVEGTYILTFRLTYFNSASARFIFRILEYFKRLQLLGCQIQIDWYYDKGDDIIIEDGEDLSKAIDIPFNFVQK